MASIELTYRVAGKSNVDVVFGYDASTVDANGNVIVTSASGTYQTLDASGKVVNTDSITGIVNSTAILHAANEININGFDPITTYSGIEFSIDNLADGDDANGHVTFGAQILGGYYESGKGSATDVVLHSGSQPPPSSTTVYSRDAKGNVTKSVETKADGSHLTEIYADNLKVKVLLQDTIVDHANNTRFVFHAGLGATTIQGFQASGQNHDVLSLPASEAGKLAHILATASNDGQGNTTLSLGHGDTITLTGVDTATLQQHKNDFKFHL